jgi:hypothetical protein
MSLLIPEPVRDEHPYTGFNELPVTDTIDPDEKVWGLWELNLTTRDSQSVRRYQIIVVQRGAGRAQYVIDMGLVLAYPVDQLSIPGAWVVSVAKVRDVADEIRFKNMAEEIGYEPTDLRNAYFDEMDIVDRQNRRVSQFGKHHMVQRTL